MAALKKVRKLPRDPGPAGWNVLLPPAAPGQPLKTRRTADWLVIGAGFAGLSAARRLAQLHPDAAIVVLEAARIGEGPAGRNSGFMIDLPHDLASDDYTGLGPDADARQTMMNRAAIDFAREAASEYGMSKELFDPCGKINGAASQKGHQHNLDYADSLKKSGEAHEVLDAASMKALTGSDYYQSGLYTPGTVMLQPAGYIRALAEGLSGKVAIYENSPAIAWERSGANWRFKTPDGSVEAPRVIMAVNGHVQNFDFFPRQLMHVFTYASMTEAMDAETVQKLGGASRWALTPADPMGATLRRISGQGGDRLVIRTRFTYDPSMEVSDGRLKTIAREQEDSFRRRFPHLGNVKMAMTWGGRLCLSWNGVPAFGEIDEHIYAACCQNGLGTAKGTLSGISAAEYASGLETELVKGMLAYDAPKRLPPEPLAQIGANTVLRWREWRAGREG